MGREHEPDRGNDRVDTDADGPAVARRRPTPDETFAAAVDLATRGSRSFKRFALRYSLCAADAEDACQRSLEMPFGQVWAYTFRHGLIVHQKLYMSQPEALEAVGLSEQDAPADS
jgi:hypothetical protein